MSLLQKLAYNDYKKAKDFTVHQCETIANLAKLNTTFTNVECPGEHLLRKLDLSGCSVSQYKVLLSALRKYRPHSKIAVLIANNLYTHLSKLATPSVDCDSLSLHLKSLGFIVVTVKNTHASHLKDIVGRISHVIPPDSYCFIFYAGHGCQIGNTKCMLGIDCPTENIQNEHCMTENNMLKQFERCNLDLCVFILDMCRINLDRETNPDISNSIVFTEDYIVHKNLLISYSTQSSQSAYEVLEIECSTTINFDETYELKTGDTDRIVPGASQYVKALCNRIGEDCDVSSLLDRVHGDVENSLRKQKPIKVQCGVEKRQLNDVPNCEPITLINKLKESIKDYTNYCDVF
ncbi:uncharacterized protein LOC101746834 [Bombyx mori]|uniref:Caspase family p20 domain-containing protein n=1 Tax=Bombyx mori TaxID=7091 RepID=A0A8R1WFR1_BOMMO|nr:uncharacterized protein LOC101746834 [Bombyx mori]